MRLAASSTRARVRASTRPLPFRAWETVVSDTPATAATSRTVGRSPMAMSRKRTSGHGCQTRCAASGLKPKNTALDNAKTCWLGSPPNTGSFRGGGRYVDDARRSASTGAPEGRRWHRLRSRLRARHGGVRLKLRRRLVRALDEHG